MRLPTLLRPRHAAAALAALAASACGGGGSTEPRAPVRTYEVAEATVPCNSVAGLSLCLSVRTPPDTAWRVLYGVVQGFTHEAGYQYVLRVTERPIRNPPPDAPGTEYRLVEVVSRVRVAP